MAVFFAYLCVVLIWATTPLAIQWSSDSLSFIAAVLARMSLALMLALIAHALLRHSLLVYWQQRHIYFAASLGIFPNMPLVYWAAQFIPSGLVAIIFAITPFATGLMTLWLLKQNPFGKKRIAALLLAMCGLCLIFYQQLHFDARSLYGVLGILLSCLLFSFSSVWVKKLSATKAQQSSAFQQATGALLFALPGLLISWWLMDGQIPVAVSTKSVGAVVYLAVIGSLLGAIFFFFILQRLSAGAVSLITLMTPVLAILLGKYVANEALPGRVLAGTGMVLMALLLYSPWSLQELRNKVSAALVSCLRREAQPTHEAVELVNKTREYLARYK